MDGRQYFPPGLSGGSRWPFAYCRYGHGGEPDR